MTFSALWEKNKEGQSCRMILSPPASGVPPKDSAGQRSPLRLHLHRDIHGTVRDIHHQSLGCPAGGSTEERCGDHQESKSISHVSHILHTPVRLAVASPRRSCVPARLRGMGILPMNSGSRAGCPCYSWARCPCHGVYRRDGQSAIAFWGRVWYRWGDNNQGEHGDPSWELSHAEISSRVWLRPGPS